MTNLISYIIIGVLFAALIGSMIYLRCSKKYKEKQKQLTQSANKLSKTLAVTKQHLKYKKFITLRAILSVVFSVLLALCLLFFLFLPVFQIKIKIEGMEPFVKNFSFIDNFLSLKNEPDKSSHYYADANIYPQILVFIVFAGFLLCAAISSFKKLKSATKDSTAEEFFIQTKLKTSTARSYNETVITLFLMCMGVLIFAIILCKNAKFNFSSYKPFTITESGRYLIYSNDDGFLLRVFRNDFKFCNGVSPQIALPIICFILAVCLFIAGAILKHKLNTAIRNEEIPPLEEKQTDSAT